MCNNTSALGPGLKTMGNCRGICLDVAAGLALVDKSVSGATECCHGTHNRLHEPFEIKKKSVKCK